MNDANDIFILLLNTYLNPLFVGTHQVINKPKVVIRPAIAPKSEDRVQYVRVVSSQSMSQVSLFKSCL